MVSLLNEAEIARFLGTRVNYPVGAVASDRTIEGRAMSATRVLPRLAFTRAAEDLLSWRVHERAGLRVRASQPRVAPGAVVELRIPVLGPLIPIRCRVTSVIETPRMAGFAYVTLDGHVEEGFEWFGVRRRESGGAEVTVRSISRPARWLPRRLPTLARTAQDNATGRYLDAWAA